MVITLILLRRKSSGSSVLRKPGDLPWVKIIGQLMPTAFWIVSEALGYCQRHYPDLQVQPQKNVVMLKSVVLAGGRYSSRVFILVQQDSLQIECGRHRCRVLSQEGNG